VISFVVNDGAPLLFFGGQYDRLLSVGHAES
jgi:hypothetical protein